MAAALEVTHILQWAEPRVSAVDIPGVGNWQADYLSHQMLDQGEWSFHSDVFRLVFA